MRERRNFNNKIYLIILPTLAIIMFGFLRIFHQLQIDKLSINEHYAYFNNNFDSLTDENFYDYLNNFSTDDSINENMLVLILTDNYIDQDLQRLKTIFLENDWTDFDIIDKQTNKNPQIINERELISWKTISRKELDSLIADTLSGIEWWDDFHKKFGETSLHSFTHPIYNADRSIMILKHTYSGGLLFGESELVILRKVEDRYVVVGKETLYVS
ncbi:MAG TPA: hypothetical protein VE912_07555 [Bacteroidales bacterium]|nr:hypothetical protein [Bacteroidales bacterium]